MILSEKYRPKTLDEVVGQDVETVKHLIENPMEMPNLLFVSQSPGTGKSTMARMIPTLLKAIDVMYLNASEERKMDTIRDRIIPFAKAKRTYRGVPRIIVMEEIDGLRKEVQEALREVMENKTYHQNVRFILTANDKTALIPPILSRCKGGTIEIVEIPRDKILKRLIHICESEKISYSDGALKKIIDINYPDMRSMIGEIQKFSKVGVTEDKIKKADEIVTQVWDLMNEGDVRKVREKVIACGLDPRFLLKRIFIDKIFYSGISKDKIQAISYYVRDLDADMARASDKEILFISFSMKWNEIK